MQMIWDLLARDEIQTLLIGAVGALFSFLKLRGSVQKWKLGVALESLEVGVQTTYEEYVRAMKEGSEDGKLTDLERNNAKRRAIETAKQYASDQGLDLVKYYGAQYLPIIIEKIVRRSKTAGKLAKAAAPFIEPQLPLG